MYPEVQQLRTNETLVSMSLNILLTMECSSLSYDIINQSPLSWIGFRFFLNIVTLPLKLVPYESYQIVENIWIPCVIFTWV